MNTKTKTEVDSIYSTSLTIGTATNVDGYVLFDNGQANKPGIKLNTATSKIQYSNNGSTWADISQSAATLGGDLSNTLDDANVVGFNGYPMDTVRTPTGGEVYYYNSVQSKWWCAQINGDVTGDNFESVRVVRLNGVEMKDVTLVDGYTLVYNQAQNKWIPDNISTTPSSSVDLFNVGGRLTLDSATPYLTSSLGYANRDTLYWAPIKGGSIALYGTSWAMYTPGEISIGIAGLTGEKLYDVFMYLNGSTPTLAFGTAWTNDNTRAVALATKDNIYVKNGANGYRYLGTVRTFGSGPISFEFSRQTIGLWNYYNRVKIPVKNLPSDNDWELTNGTSWRSFNDSASNAVAMLIGVKEDCVKVKCHGIASSGTDSRVSVGIGINVANANSAQLFGGGHADSTAGRNSLYADYEEYLEPGFNYIYALEANWYGGSVTMFGDNGATNIQTGLIGSLYG